ncbi:MAG: class I SAM-dependent methyltransferase [Caulobacterales bacterium]|nr:class I SAM-dependent methyltransferase [Caulobacterales bacterium]
MKRILRRMAKKARRRLLQARQRTLAHLDSWSDAEYLHDDVPQVRHVTHLKWRGYLTEKYDKEGARVLEVGSREVTGASTARAAFKKAEYIGLDYYQGGNVDIVGDAHKLSSYFQDGEQFDLVFSSACFEHFAFPWLVAQEMVKVCKLGGGVFVESHFSHSSHERPWNFFQFSDMGLRVMFPRALGMECVEAGMSNSIIGRFSSLADPYLRYRPVKGLYCHSMYLGRKVEEVADFDWRSPQALESALAGTAYPPPRQKEE